jgi:hypothetical protein
VSHTGAGPAGGWRLPANGWQTPALIASTLIFLAMTVVVTPFVVRGFDFNAAYKCSAAPNPACYTEQSDEVRTVGEDGIGKSAQPYIVLRNSGKFYVSSMPGLWASARAGDPATVWIYHGDVVTIEALGKTAELSSNPDLAARHVTGFEVAALGLLLCSLASHARGRLSWFTRCAQIYAVWALVSGVVVGLAVGEGPVPAVWMGFSATSLVIGILIGIEFFVLQPRIAAREAEEAEAAGGAGSAA